MDPTSQYAQYGFFEFQTKGKTKTVIRRHWAELILEDPEGRQYVFVNRSIREKGIEGKPPSTWTVTKSQRAESLLRWQLQPKTVITAEEFEEKWKNTLN